jgi:PAS domain S-box-containing protein
MSCPLPQSNQPSQTLARPGCGRRRLVQIASWCRSFLIFSCFSFVLPAGGSTAELRVDVAELVQHNQQQALQLRWLEVALGVSVLLLFVSLFSLWRLHRSRRTAVTHSAVSAKAGNTEYREMAEALKESEANVRYHYNQLQSMLESSSAVSVFALDRDYRYLFFNQRHFDGAKRIRGTEISIGMNMVESIPNPEFRAFCRKGFGYVLEGNTLSIESKEAVNSDGVESYEYNDNHGSPIFNDKGEVIGLTVFSINTTERKQLEADVLDSRNFLNQVLDAVPDPIFVKDRQHRWILVNDVFCKFIQQPREALLGKSDHDFFPKEEADIFREKSERVFDSGEVNLNEESFTSADGQQHFIQTKKTPFTGSDGSQMLVGVIHDITEHKQAEQKLKEALEFSEGIINAIPDLLFEVDREGRYLNVWAQDPTLLAAQKEILLGKTVHEVFTPENAAAAMAAIAEADENGLAHGMTICLDLPQGRRWFDHSLSRNSGHSTGKTTFLVLSRDVTERVEAERKLKEALEFSEGIINAIPDLLFEMDREGRYLNVWTHTPGFLAASRDELLHKTVNEALDRQSAAIVMEALREADEHELSFGKIINLDPPQGEQWFELSVSKMPGGNASDPHFLVLSRDITRLKQSEVELIAHRNELEERVAERTAELHEINRQLRAEIVERQRTQEELATREREFRTLAEHLPDNLARYDRQGRILYYNPALEAATGLTTAEVRGKTSVEVHQGSDFIDYQRHLMQTLATGKASEFELHLPDSGDSVRYHHILVVAEHEADGTVNGALAIGRDITARKRAERELVLLNRALDEAFDAVYLLDSASKIRYANKAAVRALGYSYEELLSMSLFDVDPFVTPQHAQALMDQVTHDGRLGQTIVTQHRRKNGECYPVEVGGAIVRYGGEILFLTTVRDISERKKAERLLHEQQEAIRAALDNAPDAIVRYDRDLRRTYFNSVMQRALEQVGITLPSLETTPAHASPIIEHERYIGLLRQVLDSGEERQAELPFSGRDETRWVDLRFAPEFDAKGRVASVLVFGRDVTMRRVMERENALLRAMADNAVDPLIFAHSMDAEAGLPMVYFNPSFARHLGYSSDEMMEIGISDIASYSKAVLAEQMAELRSKKALRFETETIRKNGERVPVEVTLSYLMHNGEELAAGYCIDISQRKDAEQRLQESHIQLQELAGHNEIVREEERKHIARELHDDLGQYLTALRLLVSATDIEYGSGGGSLAERLKQMLELIDNTKLSVRNLSQQLRPAVLDMGIFPALKWLVDEFESRLGIECELIVEDPEINMADRRATVVFRVVQESLTNISRHALAHSVSVQLKRKGDYFLLEVHDDGMGFEPSEKRIGSFGLVGMRERLLAIDGKLEVISAAGKGTRIVAYIPVHEVGNDDD